MKADTELKMARNEGDVGEVISARGKCIHCKSYQF
jgi:hypothetical protein